MPLPIPRPTAEGFTTTTPVPLYWARYARAGAPRLLLLHGGPGAHHDYLLPQMLALGERFDLTFYDQRGGGRSRTDDPAPVTWRTHVDDLGLVIAELLPDREAPAIVGYSWGGLLALLYALAVTGRSPDGAPFPVGAEPGLLALVDPAPLSRQYRREFEDEFARRQRSEVVQAMRDELAASGLRDRDPQAYRQRQFELAVAGYFHDPSRVAGLTPFRVTGKVQQTVWESLGDYDLVPLLQGLAVPTFIIHGRDDPIPLASSESAARVIPAELVVIDGCGHVPYVERPDVLFPALLRFLRRFETPAQSPPPGAPT